MSMKYKKTGLVFRGLASLLLLSSSSSVFALDGLTRNAINARYEGLAGANTALGGSPIDVALNPANLSLTKGKKIEFGVGYTAILNRYKDRFLDADPNLTYANDQRTNAPSVAPYFAVKLPITDSLDYGFAIYIAGGAAGGVDQIDRNTPTGQSVNQWAGVNLPGALGSSSRLQESNSNFFAVAKAVNGLSYKIGNLAIGAGLEVNYGIQKLNQKYYDATGHIEIPGQGYHYESGKKAYALGGVAGLNYSFAEWFRIGYSYQAHVAVPLNGTYSIGNNDPQYYRQTGVSYNFNLPEKHSLGFAFGPENLKVVVDLVYTNYGAYLKKANQTLEDPWLPTPLGKTGSADAHLNFRDQWGAILGLEHKVSQAWTYRLGYSYNSLAIGPNGLGGTTGAFFSLNHVVAAGFSYLFDKWSFDLAVSYNFPRRVIHGAKGTDWDLSHAINGPGNQNLTGYSYNSEAQLIALNIGATRSFD